MAEVVPQAAFFTALLMRQHDEQVADESCQYLDFHCIFGSAQEVLALQVLLHPLEEQFDSPALLVLLGDLEGTAC